MKPHKSAVSGLLCALLLLGSVAMPMAAVAAADDLELGDKRAELDIREESFIENDSINVERKDNRTIYGVEGPRFEITLENVNHSDVDSFGVADGEASFEYDEHRDVYVVEPAGEGTVGLYWLAEEGNESVRYAASLRVSNVDWAHRSVEKDQQLQNDAANWSEVQSEADRLDPDEDAASVMSAALRYYQFFDSPFRSFTGDIQATVIMLTLRPGGLAILGLFLAISVLGPAAGYRYRNRTQKQLAEWDDLQSERDQAWLEKARRILQQNDLTALFPDHIARGMRRLFGANTWQAFKNYTLMRSPTHTKGLVLQMMAQVGYVGVVERDDEGDVVETRAVHKTNLDAEIPGPKGVSDRDIQVADAPEFPGDNVATDGGDALETVDFENLRYDDRDDRELISSVPGSDLDMRVFDSSVTIDPDRVSLPIDNHDIDDAELISEINPRFPGDFEDEEQYARVLGELLEFVTNHPLYTDEDGRVREEMDLLSFMSEMDSIMADKADFPVADTQRKALFWIAEELDPNSKLRDELQDLQEDGVGRSGSSSDSVISEADLGLDGSALSTDGGGPR